MKIFTHQRTIAASAEEVFAAFEDPELLAKWWGPRGFTNTFSIFEFKPDGEWSFVMHGPDGTDYKNENIFIEIQKPNKIVIRHDCHPFFTATISIKDVEGGSLVSFNQDFDSEEVAKTVAPIVQPSNEQVLDKLEALITNNHD